jgi:hypothetical protein
MKGEISIEEARSCDWFGATFNEQTRLLQGAAWPRVTVARRLPARSMNKHVCCKVPHNRG